MTSTFTTNIGLEEPGLGDYNNSWNNPVNSNFTKIDNKFGSYTTITVSSGTTVLSVATSANWGILINGAMIGNCRVELPSGVSGTWFVFNLTTGPFTLKIAGSGGDTGYVLAANSTQPVYSDGANIRFPLNAAVIDTALGYTPANKAGDTFSGAVAISSGGLTVVGGETISSGNLTVTSGNAVISAGTLTVSAGLTTLSGGASISGGLTVASGTSAFGAATATTPATADNSTSVATTAFVNAEITNNLPTALAALSFGGVGTYAGLSGGGGTAPGGTAAGSGLAAYYANTNTTVTPSGTWRYMGTSAFSANGAIWLRIA